MKKDWEYYKKHAVESSTFCDQFQFEAIERLKMTPIENIALLHLIDLREIFGDKNIQINPQKQIGKYRVDFEIIHKPFSSKDAEPSHKIIVECDGHEFHEKTKQQASRDKERDRFLTMEGYTVLRYSGSDIVHHPSRIVSDIDAIIDSESYREVQEALARHGYI